MYLILLAAFLASCVYADLNSCAHKIEPIGCYADDRNNRTLNKEILNGRDVTSEVYSEPFLDWSNYNEWLSDFICKCSKKAFAQGYTVIGIQFYGECWVGHNGENYDRIGEAKTCSDSNEFTKAHDNLEGECKVETGQASTNFVYRIAPSACNSYYESVGCFRDHQKHPRPMPYYIANERDYSISNWNGKLVDWINWNTYGPNMICRCAELAKSQNHDLFAIQFWGECWSGYSNATYDRDGTSNRCRGKDFAKCACNSYFCVGMAKANYVYKLDSNPNE